VTDIHLILAGTPGDQILDSLDEMTAAARLLMAHLATGHAQVLLRRDPPPPPGQAPTLFPICYLLCRPQQADVKLERSTIRQLRLGGFITTGPRVHDDDPLAGRAITLSEEGIMHQLQRASVMFNGVATPDVQLTPDQADLMLALAAGALISQDRMPIDQAAFQLNLPGRAPRPVRPFDLRMLSIIGFVQGTTPDWPVPWSAVWGPTPAGSDWTQAHRP